MQWDVGPYGLGVLAVMSVAYGAFAQIVFWGRATWWVGLGAAAVFFVGGLLISEVWFGWATQAELQPNIDGLSFDEVLLGYVVGVPLALMLRYLTARREVDRTAST